MGIVAEPWKGVCRHCGNAIELLTTEPGRSPLWFHTPSGERRCLTYAEPERL